jgi:hypothetical protein
MNKFIPKYKHPGGVQRVERAAQLGEPYAIWYLANLYFHGLSELPRDYRRSYDLHLKAAKLGFPPSHRALAHHYKFGIGCKKNGSKSIAHLKTASRLADPQSQTLLGRHYFDRATSNKNIELAKTYLTLAAHNDDINAKARLAWLNLVGGPYLSSPGATFEFLIRKAKEGCDRSQLCLAYMYLGGEITGVINTELALTHLRSADDQGNPEAIFALGDLLIKGHGCEQDQPAGLKLVLEADRLGFKDARGLAGFCYGMGYGTPANHEIANIYLEDAVKNDSPRGEYFLAMFMNSQVQNDPEHTGRLVKLAEASLAKGQPNGYETLQEVWYNTPHHFQNDAPVLPWLRRAACLNTWAPRQLADYYFGRPNISQADKDLGMFWLQCAANDHDELAVKGMGHELLRGKFCKKDPSEAMAWFECGAALGNPECASYMAYEFNFNPALISNPTYGAKLNEYAALHGVPMGAHNLGCQYFDGSGVEYSETTGSYWKQLGAELRIKQQENDNQSSIDEAEELDRGRDATIIPIKREA